LAADHLEGFVGKGLRSAEFDLRRSRYYRILIVCLATICLMVTSARPLQAQHTWIGTPGAVGDWFDGNNWSNGAAPASGSVVIENAGTAQHAQNLDTSISTLTLGGATASDGKLLIEAGTFSAAAVNVGGNGTGYLRINGGSNTFGSLSVFVDSTLRYTAGAFDVAALTVHGTLDLAESSVTIAPTGIANLASASFQGTSSATLIGAADSLMIFSPGVVPANTFGTFSTQGIVHIAGTTLVLSSGQTIDAVGDIPDRVEVHGTLRNARPLGGVNLRSGAVVNVPVLTVVDATSDISNGSLTTNNFVITDGATFTQSGGEVAMDRLRLGTSPTAVGTYILSGGTFTRMNPRSGDFAALLDSGTFLHTGGTNYIVAGLGDGLGITAGSHMHYEFSGGTISSTSSRFNIGTAGAGTLIQTGGHAQIANPRLGIGMGGTGYYSLSGDGSMTISATLGIGATGIGGVGTFVQSGGTISANAIIVTKNNTTTSLFTKSGGAMSATFLTNGGTFLHSGGTLTASSMSNTGTASLGGIQAWNASSTFTNTGFATFATNAGSLARNLTINANGGTVVLDAPQTLKGLVITSGRVKLLPGEPAVLGVTELSMDTSAVESLDLADGTLAYLYDGATPSTTIRSLLDSTQMYSSLSDSQHRLGYAEATQVYASLPSLLGNEPLDSTTLLARLTLAGDTDLNGTVDVADLGQLAAHWAGTNKLWYDGDFTYDGNVDVADLKLLAMNFNQAASGPGLETLLLSFGLPAEAVPEPTAIAPLLLGAMLIRRRGF
jgi:hypothetical protein